MTFSWKCKTHKRELHKPIQAIAIQSNPRAEHNDRYRCSRVWREKVRKAKLRLECCAKKTVFLFAFCGSKERRRKKWEETKSRMKTKERERKDFLNLKINSRRRRKSNENYWTSASEWVIDFPRRPSMTSSHSNLRLMKFPRKNFSSGVFWVMLKYFVLAIVSIGYDDECWWGKRVGGDWDWCTVGKFCRLIVEW